MQSGTTSQLFKRTQSASMSETKLSASIRGALAANGFWVVRLGSVGHHGKRSLGTGEPGLPDIMLVGLGFLEVKTDKGKLSAVQVAWHQKATHEGVRVATVRSVRDALTIALAWRRESSLPDDRKPT